MLKDEPPKADNTQADKDARFARLIQAQRERDNYQT